MTASLRGQIRIFLADEDAIFRDSLRLLLEHEPDFQVVGEAGDGCTVLECLPEARPHLLLLNMILPGMTGIEVLRSLPEITTGIRTMIVTAEIDWLDAIEALELGAQGIVLKDTTPDLLSKSIRTVMGGEYWISHGCIPQLVNAISPVSTARREPDRGLRRLSQRERQIAAAVLEGRTNSEVAQEFCIAEHTVKNHLGNIFAKLRVRHRLELARSAMHRPSGSMGCRRIQCRFCLQFKTKPVDNKKRDAIGGSHRQENETARRAIFHAGAARISPQRRCRLDHGHYDKHQQFRRSFPGRKTA